MITITDSASEKIKQLIQKNYTKKVYLRIAITGGGCSGFMKKLIFESEIKENDMMFNIKDCDIIIDNKSALYLSDSMLDYKDTLMGAGFILNIASAKNSC